MNKAQQKSKIKRFSELLEDKKMRQATIMLVASVLVLSIAVVALNAMGFFHMLAGLGIPRGMVKPGVIFAENQITEIPEGEIRYRLNTDVIFENLYGHGSIMLENPAVSQYDLEFAFYLPKDQKNPVYESPRLRPGECLMNDKLTDTMSLRRGDHTCMCVVSAYDKDGNYIGKNTCTVRLIIYKN